MGTTEPHRAELMRRCAWCGRALLDGVWRELDDDVAAHLLARLTHTICPDCVERLEGEGLSR